MSAPRDIAPTDRLTLASWNVHRGRGRDGAVDAGRVLDALRGEIAPAGPDIVVLQEADEERRPHAAVLRPEDVEHATGLSWAQADPETRWSAASLGFLGVAVFLRASVAVERVTLLDLPGHCHRGAVLVDTPGWRLIATHLSLGQPARIAQMRVIGQHLMRRSPKPAILAGDLNEWRPWGGAALSRKVTGLRLAGPARASFPVGRPILPLDRALAELPWRVETATVLDGPVIREASDHRPLLARLVRIEDRWQS